MNHFLKELGLSLQETRVFLRETGLFYSMEDAGKSVWYRLRWVSKSGEKGG